MEKIAVIGVGIMGNGIASNFLKNGYEVYVWNRHKEKLQDLAKNGAKILETPKQGAELADIVFEVTANDESSKSVWLDENGILAGARGESVLVTSATLSVKWVDELANICRDKNLTFFDLPMTGGRAAAESGKLTLLAGGDEQKLEELKPTLGAISEKVIYFGKAGAGARYKLINNMLAAIHIIGFGEAMKIAKATGLDLKTVGDTLSLRPGGLTTNMSWRDYQNHPDPINFSVKWITKDLTYAKELVSGENLVLLNDALNKYKEAIDRGMAEEDWTAVNRF